MSNQSIHSQQSLVAKTLKPLYRNQDKVIFYLLEYFTFIHLSYTTVIVLFSAFSRNLSLLPSFILNYFKISWRVVYGQLSSIFTLKLLALLDAYFLY